MASYFSPTNNQTDAAPMLYLRGPLPSICSESRVLPTNKTMYMNFSSSSGSYSDAMAVNSQRQTNYMDMEPVGASDSNTSQVLLNFGGSRAVEPNFSRNDMLLMNPGASNVLQCGPSQGLSLSLGTQVPSTMQISSLQYQNAHSNFSSNISFEDEGNFHAKQSRDNDFMFSGVSGSNVDVGKDDVPQYGMPGISRAVPNSKYLKAAQELLDEVVNVKKAITEQHAKKELMKSNGASDPSAASSVPTETNKNELPDAEKQDLQSKVAKLLSMLEEVDRRYRQYYHQMQIVVSSLDTVVGHGSAKPYTTLALQTISRHFRCLRDAINIQIRMVRKSLGEEDSSSLNDKGGVGISRLRFVDQQLRQQRALQQLGMTQHAWRPQRGLPETSVSILRAWLFEHFLHPYPKDSDKIMLARQTGLTRSQVSNWFINARVRLWKPMVEEMYKEEARDAEIDSNSSSETMPKPVKTTDTKASENQGEDNNRHFTTSTSEPFGLNSDEAPNLEIMGSDTNPSFQNLLNADPQSDRFMYHMSELERFGNGGGVSLTLGLQQCEGDTMGIADGTEHGFSLHDFYSSMKD